MKNLTQILNKKKESLYKINVSSLKSYPRKFLPFEEAREFVKELQKQTSEIGYVLREISTGNRVYIIN